jgi:hypothetical protein
MIASIGIGVGLVAPYGAIENVTLPEGARSSHDITASAVTVLLGLTVLELSVRYILQSSKAWTWLNPLTTKVYISEGAFISKRFKIN